MDLTLGSEDFEIYKRYLPHWRANNIVYFVTWRLWPETEGLSPDERSLVSNVVEHFHTKRYWLLAYVIMNDHVHLLVRIARERPLQSVLHSWKSFSANRLQREFGRSGAVWQDESFDRIVRDADELQNILQYIASNPVKRWPGTTEYRWCRIFNEFEE